MTTIARAELILVTVGVDTHRDTHTAVALDQLGRRLGELCVDTRQAGYDELVAWASSFGQIEAFGVEGTNSYGAGLTRALRAQGFAVVEVARPKRTNPSRAKSDPIDAEAAARAVLAGDTLGTPKAGTDKAEMVRVLRVARTTAMKARTQTINAMRALIVTAPGELRDELRQLTTAALVQRAARFRLDNPTTTTAAAKRALRVLARRYQHLTQEIAELDDHLDALVAAAAPTLVGLFGFGTDTAGQLLVTAGDNPTRLASEASFSMLCASSPIPASSGKTSGRHRLNRGGDRHANAALYRVVIVRMRHQQATRDYVERRTKQGKTKLEIIRCLKRYVAREAFNALKKDLAAPPRHL